MELHAEGWPIGVLQGHQHSVPRPRRRPQAGWECVFANYERVVSRRRQRIRQSGEEAITVMLDERRPTMNWFHCP
jgi:hypothetical protein